MTEPSHHTGHTRVRIRTGPCSLLAASALFMLAACGGATTETVSAAADITPISVAAEHPPPPTLAAAVDIPTAAAPSTPPAAPTGQVLSASPPVSLSVPMIGVNSSLIQLGLNPDGSIEVPSLDDPEAKPGWYRNSPTPGAIGPSIILGHVDSRRYGPGVFYSLKDLHTGDSIEVTRADNIIAIFTIDSVESVAKSDFPTLRVYGNLDHPGLRLITCGGEFDPGARSYESNIIVFATLTGSRPA